MGSLGQHGVSLHPCSYHTGQATPHTPGLRAKSNARAQTSAPRATHLCPQVNKVAHKIRLSYQRFEISESTEKLTSSCSPPHQGSGLAAVWPSVASGRLLRPRSLQGPSTFNLRQLWPWAGTHRALGAPLGLDGNQACPSATTQATAGPRAPPLQAHSSFNWAGLFCMGRQWAAPPWLQGPHGPPPSPHPFCCGPISCLPHSKWHSGTLVSTPRTEMPRKAGLQCPHVPARAWDMLRHERARGPQGRYSLTHTRVRAHSLNPCHFQRATRHGANARAQCLEKAPSRAEPPSDGRSRCQCGLDCGELETKPSAPSAGHGQAARPTLASPPLPATAQR